MGKTSAKLNVSIFILTIEKTILRYQIDSIGYGICLMKNAFYITDIPLSFHALYYQIYVYCGLKLKTDNI